jgi:2,4-dienoyl-CoA reductase-like NADH-dependent reductase (Old Yellow Enzyme family)/thioredoxin reductase
MAFNRLFEQVQVGPLTLKNRLILPGMERGYATPLGEVTQRYVDYIEARARGGVGLIVVESTYVEPSGKVRLAQLGVHDNSLIPGLRRLADVCHAHGVKIGTQITHAGRQTSSQFTGKQPIAPSSISCSRVPSSEPVREMAVAEIEAYVRKFAEAAKRLQDAGFDLIEVHGAHGYLINQFVSPYTNKRNDAYGGTAEKRMRFPLEIVAAVRAAVGEGLAISYRLSAHEFVEGGLVPEDLVPLVKALERAGVDIVGVSAGNYDSVVWTTPGPDCPPGYYAELAKPIKAALKIPVYVAGRINTPELAERLIREGKTDLVAMARVLHADPEMPNKARQGKVEEIRRCVYCMHCSDLLSSNQLVSCLVNPAAGRERTFQRVGSASAPKRVVVAGGGPAGLAAARSLASKGHKVILFEKEAKMGGQIPYAASAPHKEEFIEVVSYLIRQVDKLGVEVRMGKTATVEAVMALNPDVAVIATGARPNYPPIQGIDPTSVRTALEVLGGKASIPGKALVMGGGMTGCETAEYLANRGSEVVLVEMTDALARDAGSRSSYPIKKRVSEHQHIQIHLLTIVTEVGDDYAVLQQGGVSMRVEELGLIVVSTGMLADRTLADALIAAGFKGQLHVIGDSERPRKAADAIYEGETLGLML